MTVKTHVYFCNGSRLIEKLTTSIYIAISDDLSNGTNETYLSNDALLTVDYNATQSVHLHNNVSRHRGTYASIKIISKRFL